MERHKRLNGSMTLFQGIAMTGTIIASIFGSITGALVITDKVGMPRILNAVDAHLIDKFGHYPHWEQLQRDIAEIKADVKALMAKR